VVARILSDVLVTEAADEEAWVRGGLEEMEVLAGRVETSDAAASPTCALCDRLQNGVQRKGGSGGRHVVGEAVVDGLADPSTTSHVCDALAQEQQLSRRVFVGALLASVDAKRSRLVDGGLDPQDVDLVVHLHTVAAEPMTNPQSLVEVDQRRFQ
jgi:hypothetical protein